MTRDEQTEKIKLELLKLVSTFVNKYQPQYYKQYKGDKSDLAMEIYTAFLTPKSKDPKGEKKNLLDRFDESVTSLPYFVKVATINRLISLSKKDRGEVRAQEKYDEETGALSLDWLFNKASSSSLDTTFEDIEFSDEDIKKAKKVFNSMSQAEKDTFLRRLSRLKGKLSENVQNFLFKVVGSGEFIFKPWSIWIKANPSWKEAKLTEGKFGGKQGIRVDYPKTTSPKEEKELIEFFDDYDYIFYKSGSGHFYFVTESNVSDSNSNNISTRLKIRDFLKSRKR